MIATERIHRVVVATGGAALMLLIGATDAEHAFFSEHAGIDWNVIFLLCRGGDGTYLETHTAP